MVVPIMDDLFTLGKDEPRPDHHELSTVAGAQLAHGAADMGADGGGTGEQLAPAISWLTARWPPKPAFRVPGR